MFRWMNNKIDQLSEYLASRKGLLPLIGLVFIIVNLILQFSISGWLVESNLFLHIGIIIAIIGLMVAWAL